MRFFISNCFKTALVCPVSIVLHNAMNKLYKAKSQKLSIRQIG